jgi:hypothetical protein
MGGGCYSAAALREEERWKRNESATGAVGTSSGEAVFSPPPSAAAVALREKGKQRNGLGFVRRLAAAGFVPPQSKDNRRSSFNGADSSNP